MADPIAQLCQMIAEQLRDEPELEQADLVARVERVIASHPELVSALKTDPRMLQINRDGARGFQTLVEEGGTVFIEDTHYHLVEPEKFEAALEAVLQTIQTPKAKTFDFKPYLQSIVDDDEYRELQDVYTPTTVEGRKQEPQKKFSPRLKLRVETVKLPTEELEERKASEDQEQVKQWEVLAGLRNYAVNHVLLIGKPGSGKSTALAWLLWQESNTALQNPAAKIPVLVRLRRCSSTIEHLIQVFFSSHQLSLDVADIEELLHQGKLLLLLDGLNELPERFRTEIVNFRDRYRSTTPMIVSTRDLGVGGTLGITKTLKMLPLTEPQMQEFVRGYLGDKGDRLFQQLKGDRLRKFAETPLLLWMLCRVFAGECVQAEKEQRTPKLPDNLGLAFRKFTQLYDQGTAEQQAIQADAPVDSRRHWPKLLRHLAFALMQDKELVEFRLSMPREEAEHLLAVCLHQEGRANARDCAERWLNDLLTYHLIQPVIQPNFEEHIEFRHQLIQEYYAAEYLLRLLPGLSDEQLKRDYLNYLKWTEPIALMLALVDNEAQALRVVKLALEVDWRLGAQFAGTVREQIQQETVAMVNQLKVPKQSKLGLITWTQRVEAPSWLKAQLLWETRSKCAIPGLRNLLKSEDADDNVRWIVVRGLGSTRSEEVIPDLLNLLKDNSIFVRLSAGRELENVASEKTIPFLLERLKDPDGDISLPAARALGHIASESTIPVLQKLREQPPALEEDREKLSQNISPDVSLHASFFKSPKASNTVSLGSVAGQALSIIASKMPVTNLLKFLENTDSGVSWQIALNLGLTASESAIPALLKLLEDSDQNVRWIAVSSLGLIGTEAATSALLKLLEDPDPIVRSMAVNVSGSLGSQVAIPYLLELLEDDSKDVYERSTAALALGFTRSETAVPALIKLLRENNSNIRERAAEALGIIGSKTAVPALISLLEETISSMRGKTLYGLCIPNSDSEIATSGWHRVLNSIAVEPDVCVKAAEALGRIGSEAAISPLLHFLENPDANARKIAVLALGIIGSKTSIPHLLKALEDSDPNVREIVVEALGNIASEEAVPALRKALKDSCCAVRRSATYALGDIGSESAIPDLLKLLKDEGFVSDPRGSAVVTALTKIAMRHSKKMVQSLPYLLDLISTDAGREAFNVVLSIQSNCQFYNYKLWQDSIQNWTLEEQNAISDLQNILKKLRTQHPQVTTEAEALAIINTEFPKIKQAKTHQLETLRQQLLNPERHLQAIKAAGGEVANHYLEENVWVKAVITYLDKMSETPNQGA